MNFDRRTLRSLQKISPVIYSQSPYDFTRANNWKFWFYFMTGLAIAFWFVILYLFTIYQACQLPASFYLGRL